MLGWFNDAIEKLVVDKFGVEFWHTVKETANVDLVDQGFCKLEAYDDSITFCLLEATAHHAHLSLDQLLEAFGEFFSHYLRRHQGYDSLLQCQGSNLQNWLSNINAIHQHLQSTWPTQISMPLFYVSLVEQGALRVEYYSAKRGAYFAPFCRGFILEVAASQFDVAVHMEPLTTQGVDGERVTSWKVTTVDPTQQWKLARKNNQETTHTSTSINGGVVKCPFSGRTTQLPPGLLLANSTTLSPTTDAFTTATEPSATPTTCPKRRRVSGFEDATSTTTTKSGDETTRMDTTSNAQNRSRRVSNIESLSHTPAPENATTTTAATTTLLLAEEQQPEQTTATANSSHKNGTIGLSPTLTQTLFPHHIMLSSELIIAQVGHSLEALLQQSNLVGRPIASLLQIRQPIRHHNKDDSYNDSDNMVQWKWEYLQQKVQQGQAMELEPLGNTRRLVLKTTLVAIDQHTIMLIMTPDAHNLHDLQQWNLTLSDFSQHAGHADLIMAREHLSHQIHSAARMEKLSQCLEREKTLLESLLPHHAVERLRVGKPVEPRLHDAVTFFFSDIVSFTNICNHLQPGQVIAMLNELYSMMDYLAGKFHLFKVETIGDAYVCCSGLPQSDEDHARNVANFAIAVNHCCRHVKSPVDNTTPIQLRIGVHTGTCASGVVGTKNPRYCVFGDTVNTTSRHESTGKSGMIHCSGATRDELLLLTNNNDSTDSSDWFVLNQRDEPVFMKGKGMQTTYWLEAHESNPFVNAAALEELDVQVQKVLAKTNLKNHEMLQNGSSCEVTRQVHSLRKMRQTLSLTNVLSSASLVSNDSNGGNEDDAGRSKRDTSTSSSRATKPTLMVRRGSSLQLLETSAEEFRRKQSVENMVRTMSDGNKLQQNYYYGGDTHTHKRTAIHDAVFGHTKRTKTSLTATTTQLGTKKGMSHPIILTGAGTDKKCHQGMELGTAWESLLRKS